MKTWLKISVAITPILLYTPLVDACSVCFYGDPTQASNIALRLSIITLLCFLLVVLGLFIKFFINFRKRAALLKREIA